MNTINDTKPGLRAAKIFIRSKMEALLIAKSKTFDLQVIDRLDAAIIALSQVSERIDRAIGPEG